MFSVNDFISQYENYTDEELMDVHSNIDGYSNEAKEALAIVLDKKGGLDALLKRLADQKTISDEVSRIAKEAHELGSQGVDAEFIQKTTNSDILSADKIAEIVKQKYSELEAEKDDKTIKARTIAGSVIGGLLVSIIGGVLLGVTMIYSQKVLYIFIIGLAIFSYQVIKAATKQTSKNIIVLIATVLSIILAVYISQFIYSNPELLGITPK